MILASGVAVSSGLSYSTAGPLLFWSSWESSCRQFKDSGHCTDEVDCNRGSNSGGLGFGIAQSQQQRRVHIELDGLRFWRLPPPLSLSIFICYCAYESNDQSWVALKAVIRRILWASHMIQGPQHLSLHLLLFEAISRELQYTCSSKDVNWCQIGFWNHRWKISQLCNIKYSNILIMTLRYLFLLHQHKNVIV